MVGINVFLLFVLSVLLCPTMKLFVKCSFLHLLENTDFIEDELGQTCLVLSCAQN